MTEQKFEWRKMTGEELDQFDPAGVHAFCETFALMEEHWGPVRIAIDEYVIALEFALLQQSRPDDPDVLLAVRDHSMGVEFARQYIERVLPITVRRKQLVELGFCTEII